MCQVLSEYGLPMQDLSIEGHIHADPNKNSDEQQERQMRISMERAEAVVAAIVNHNVPMDKLHGKGFEGTRPKGTPEQNRRVEIYMTVPKTRRGSMFKGAPGM